MLINLPLGNHTARVTASALPQRDGNGYGGFGYGGERLYAAWNEDCFQPAIYLIRADSFEDAYEVAEASLAPIVTEEDLGRPISEFNEVEWADEMGYRWAVDGSLVYTEALHLVQVGGPAES